jgi:hypothetical protein
MLSSYFLFYGVDNLWKLTTVYLRCGVAQLVVRKASPSAILGSASHGSSSLAERRSDEDTRKRPWRMVKDE